MHLAPDITPEDLKVFLAEAEEHIQLLDQAFVRMEQEGESPQLLQEIFRAAHTLKGSSAMLGYAPMAELAHVMESLLDRIRRGALAMSPPVADALLNSLDALRQLKDALARGAQPPDVRGAKAGLEQIVAAPAPPPRRVGAGATPDTSLTLDAAARERLRAAIAAVRYPYHVQAVIHASCPFPAARLFQVITELAALGEIVTCSPSQAAIQAGETESRTLEALVATTEAQAAVEPAVRSVPDVERVTVAPYAAPGESAPPAQEGAPPLASEAQQVAPAQQQDQGAAKRPAEAAQTVRIDVERLDSLMNLIGELVIDRTRLIEIARALETHYRTNNLVEALGKTSGHFAKVVDQLQGDIMKTRLVPIGAVFNTYPRMMRDLSRRLGKKLNFVVEGQDTEVDRSIIDKVRDPLVHLLRNALDHGVETPQERRAAGKPETATVRLRACQDQGQIVVTIEDDGRGISADKLRAAAVKKGLMSDEDAQRLTDSEAIDLIFLAGLSTKEQVTDTSGRGVGMDVVKTNIKAINGFLSVDTALGKGATFSMRLPLTLATVHALLVRAGKYTYAIPLIYVLEAVRPRRDAISTVRGRPVMRLRDRIVPLVRLGPLMGLRVQELDLASLVSVVIVHLGDKLLGLAVDALVTQQEVTIKSLGNYVGGVGGVAGASVMGDGQVVLIVDVPSLMHLAARTPAEAVRAA